LKEGKRADGTGNSLKRIPLQIWNLHKSTINRYLSKVKGNAWVEGRRRR